MTVEPWSPVLSLKANETRHVIAECSGRKGGRVFILHPFLMLMLNVVFHPLLH